MSKTQHKSIPYRGECRNCGHLINRPMPPTQEFLSNNEGIHVRCAECGTENTVHKAEVEV